MEDNANSQQCEWCSKAPAYRNFGGWWICRPCDIDFFSRNGRAERVHDWLAARGKVPQWTARPGSVWKLWTRYTK